MSAIAQDYRSISVNTMNNRVSLRSDLSGRGLDKGHFCFYPYANHWVTLWIGNGSLHLARTHNFREVNLPSRIRAFYLFARFVWNNFYLANEPLQLQEDVLHFVEGDDDGDDGNHREEEDDEDDDENEDSHQHDNGGRGKQETKRKRKRKERDEGGGSGRRGGKGGGGPGLGAQRKKQPARRGTMPGERNVAMKRRLDAALNDPTDLSPITPSYLEEISRLDRLSLRKAPL